MKIKIKKADAILTTDWHLRESTPLCRTDDFWEAQWSKVGQICGLQEKHDCPVIHAGDLFHHWKPSPFLLSMTIECLPKQFFTVLGNHDLPQHNLSLTKKSGVYTLAKANSLEILEGYHWMDEDENEEDIIIKDRRVVVSHEMTYVGNQLPHPGCTDGNTQKLIKYFKRFKYDLIVTGHNHQTFTDEKDGVLLVNPGCLTRQEAGDIHHVPTVFLYYADTNTVKPVELNYEPGVVSRQHIVQKENREDRITAFIEHLSNGGWDKQLSFEKNVENFMEANNVPDEVKEIVNKAIYD